MIRVALLFFALVAGCGAEDDRRVVVVTPDGQTTAIACGTTCTGPSPDDGKRLGDDEIRRLLGQFRTDELAVDTLLFHADEVAAHLDAHPDAVSVADGAWLRAELSRDQVAIRFRLVDDLGDVRGELDEVVRLSSKQHLKLRGTEELGRVEVNGKIKRVGLHHLWTRF